jgi:hypothetical protein
MEELHRELMLSQKNELDGPNIKKFSYINKTNNKN